MRRVGLVCFDWGGVILRICRSWAEGCAAAGLDVRGDSAAPAHRQERHALAMRYQDGALTTDDFLAQLAASTDGLYSKEDVLAIHNAWLLGEYKGIGAVVDRLNRDGAALKHERTALATPFDRARWIGSGLSNRWPTHAQGGESSCRCIQAFTRDLSGDV